MCHAWHLGNLNVQSQRTGLSKLLDIANTMYWCRLTGCFNIFWSRAEPCCLLAHILRLKNMLLSTCCVTLIITDYVGREADPSYCCVLSAYTNIPFKYMTTVEVGLSCTELGSRLKCLAVTALVQIKHSTCVHTCEVLHELAEDIYLQSECFWFEQLLVQHILLAWKRLLGTETLNSLVNLNTNMLHNFSASLEDQCMYARSPAKSTALLLSLNNVYRILPSMYACVCDKNAVLLAFRWNTMGCVVNLQNVSNLCQVCMIFTYVSLKCRALDHGKCHIAEGDESPWAFINLCSSMCVDWISQW